MKKIFLCCIIILFTAGVFCACNSDKSVEEVSTAEENTVITEDVSHILNAERLDKVLYTPDECYGYLDREYDSEKNSYGITEYYKDNKLVMVKKFDGELLCAKEIFSDINYKMTYSYENGQLSEFKCTSDKSTEIGRYKSGLVIGYSYLINTGKNIDFFAGEFDENGNVINKMDDYEELSHKLSQAIYNNLIKAIKDDLS